MPERQGIYLPDIIGKGYKKFWEFKGRYLVVKGGRGSKKSCTASLKIIHNMMKYPQSNTLCVRRYFYTHRDSTYAQLQWAIKRLGVSHYWKTTLNPLEIIYIPTGQKIMFRGFDDPLSITSITVPVGVLCWIWIEEAFQITNEKEFDKLDLSIRGQLPAGLYKQFIFTFNPWSSNTWLKKRFFDAVDDPDILAITTNYLCNEFLPEEDLKIFEKMKLRDSKRYSIEGLGDWGISGGLVYSNWEEYDFDPYYMMRQVTRSGIPVYKKLFGMDFGFTHPFAFIATLVDKPHFTIYIFDELYKSWQTSAHIAKDIKEKGFENERIRYDNENPQIAAELKMMGLHNIIPTRKGNNSVYQGIHKLQGYRLLVHPSCVNTQMELSNYLWKQDESGRFLDEPIKEYDHLMDALRYATEPISTENFSF